MNWSGVLGVVFLMASCVSFGNPVAADALPLQKDIREEIVRIPAKVTDPFGEVVQGDLIVTTFRPPGDGPFPLVVISHGRNPDTRKELKRQRFESASRYFVRKGFAVAVPLRLGYGELADKGDPEFSVECRNPRYAPALDAAAQEILTVVKFMEQFPYIDSKKIVLAGVSVGGISTMAATAVHIEGQVAAIDFSGGHGGNPKDHPGEPCAPEKLRQLFSQFGAMNASAAPPTPSLWIYAENDHYFAPRFAKRWASAYHAAGGDVDLRVLPPFANEGHQIFAAGNDIWQPMVDEFLNKLGFDHPGALQKPQSSNNLPVDDLEALPVRRYSVIEGYKKFLSTKLPHAFAVSKSGGWGYATGDDAMSRALASCHQHSDSCQLYVVDDKIVWPEATLAKAQNQTNSGGESQ